MPGHRLRARSKTLLLSWKGASGLEVYVIFVELGDREGGDVSVSAGVALTMRVTRHLFHPSTQAFDTTDNYQEDAAGPVGTSHGCAEGAYI